jgi:hypothetical protein
VAQHRIGPPRDLIDDCPVPAPPDPLDPARPVLVPERVSEGLHRMAGVDGEAVEVQQEMQLAQRELAVPAEDAQAGRPELDTAHEPGVMGDRRHRRLVRPGRPASPAAGQRRPQLLVDVERLLDQRPPPAYELRSLLVECIERVDDHLASPVQHVPFDPPQPGRVPSRRVRIVLQPAG